MPRTCFVPGCKSGLRSEIKRLKINGLNVPHMFHAPKNKVEEWQKKIGQTAKVLTFTSSVCEKHFLPEDIISDWKHKGPDGTVVRIPRERVALHPDAVPCIFPNKPVCLHKHATKRETPTQTIAIEETKLVDHQYRHKYTKMKSDKRTTEVNIKEVQLTSYREREKNEVINGLHVTKQLDMEKAVSTSTCEPSDLLLERIKKECSYDEEVSEAGIEKIAEEYIGSKIPENMDNTKPIAEVYIKKERDTFADNTFNMEMNRIKKEDINVESRNKCNLSSDIVEPTDMGADRHEVKVKIEQQESGMHISEEELFIKSELDPLTDGAFDMRPHSTQIKKIHKLLRRKAASNSFSCYNCKYTTISRNNLSKHMRVHAKLLPTKYVCSQCNRGYQTKSTLDEHTLKYHPKLIASVTSKIHRCTECTYRTVMKPSLSRHMLIHPKITSSFKFRDCVHCDALFKSKAALNDHILRQHPDSVQSLSCKIYQCANCTYKTTKKDHIVTHMSKHPGAATRYDLFRCMHCDAEFKRKIVLDDHILRKHFQYVSSVTSKIHKCTNCAYITTRNSFLTRHILTYCKFISIYSTCTKCKARFTKKAELDAHIVERHANLNISGCHETYECKKCNYKSTCKKSVAQHMMKHPEAEYSCKSGRCVHCGAKFRDKLRLDDHITRYHLDFDASNSSEMHACAHCTFRSGSKDELAEHLSKHIYRTCVHCKRVFKRKIAFDNHIIQKHPDFIASVSSKIHKCKECLFRTTLKSELKEHMLVHHELTGKRKITFEHCGIIFKRQIALDNHIVKRHPEYIASITHYLHTCTNCAYKTTIKSNLTKHLLMKHSDSPPTPQSRTCPQCDAVYKSKVMLDDHIVKKHPTCTALVASKVHECRKCGFKTTIKTGYYKHMQRHAESSLDEHVLGESRSTFEDIVKKEFPGHAVEHYQTSETSIIQDETISQYFPKYSTCLHCNLLYKSKNALDHHIIKTHPDLIASVTSKINKCTVCDFKTVRSKAILDDHILQSHPDSVALITSEIHECMNCTFRTTMMHTFSRHVKTHVIRSTPRYRCLHCDGLYRSQVALDDHIIKIHPNFIASIHGRIQRCTMCDFKTAKSKPVLDDHILKKHPNSDASVTSQVKECTECNFKTTNSKTALDDHIVKKHPDSIASVTSQIYECTRCHLKTTIKSNFTKHVSTHPQIVP